MSVIERNLNRRDYIFESHLYIEIGKMRYKKIIIFHSSYCMHVYLLLFFEGEQCHIGLVSDIYNTLVVVGGIYHV